MTRVVRVAVPRPLRRTFDYAVPDGCDSPVVGARVRVPFARGTVVGVVTEIGTHSEHELKPIGEVLDDKPILTPDVLALAEWLARYYHHPIGEVYATLLPVAARRGASAATKPKLRFAAVEPDTPPDLARAPRQLAVWRHLVESGPLLQSELADIGSTRPALRALEAKGLVTALPEHASYRLQPSDIEPTAEQRLAIDAITRDLERFAVHLLDGITGSGKTEVYLRAIATVLERNRQALVLVPEIALTPQTTERFRERFAAAAILHSAMSEGERFETWMRAASGEHRIVIGTRSAVFTPFADLGLIVVDEEHDPSYKQGEGLRYSARDVAIKRADANGIPCVLGSATPSLETLTNVERGRYRVSTLSRRPGTAVLPSFHLIDIRGQRLEGGMSTRLLETIERHLEADGQVLVFINRRGYAPSLFCTQCGWQARCADCDVRLTLHEQPRVLRCHHCDRVYSVPSRCPDCGQGQLIALGAGTQRCEETLRERFPDVPLMRVDRDTTRSQAKLDRLFTELRTEPVGERVRRIMVGTQMLAKGHHLPNVTLVAVLDADNGFLSADFRAPERTAQLIVQVAGRAGRAERPGEVWLQTYDPDNANLNALVTEGYAGFAQTESANRREAGLPPFRAMALLRAESPVADDAESFLGQLLAELKVTGVETAGPVPAPIARKSQRFRFQGMVLASERRRLHAALTRIESATPKRSQVRWSIDVDPADTF